MAIGIEYHVPVTFSGGVSGIVASLAKAGSSALTGAVTLTGGTNVTLTQAGNDISIAAAGGGGGGTELDYAQVTAALTVTATSDAGANTFITGNAVSYSGSQVVYVEVYAPYMDITAAQAVVLNLYDGSTDLGRISNLQCISASGAGGLLSETVAGKRRLTPSAGSHTYSVRAWKTGGTAHVGAGAGGTAAYMPAFLRIVTA